MVKLSTYKRVFLLGFRATGKSTIGHVLAQRLGWSWVDLDQQIQQETNKTVAELTKDGQNWVDFRKIETEVLDRLLKRDNLVVSCGGGVGVNNIKNSDGIQYGQIQADLLHNGKDTLNIVLDGSEDVILNRLKLMFTTRESNHRVSLAGLNGDLESMIAENQKLFRDRKPLYLKLSQHILNTTEQKITDSVEEIIDLLKNPNK